MSAIRDWKRSSKSFKNFFRSRSTSPLPPPRNAEDHLYPPDPHSSAGDLFQPVVPSDHSNAYSSPGITPSNDNNNTQFNVPQRYRYKSLQPNSKTRVVVLHPGQDANSPLICSLVDVGNEALYDAISYAWGTGEQTEKLFVDTRDHYLDISIHVRDMLFRLRYPYEQRYLWIDAICIHQADTAEKNSQVQHMSEIYAQARETIIWLGDNTEKGSYIFSLLNSPLSNFVTKYSPRQEIVSVQLKVTLFFIQVSWYHRRWTIQEVTLARKATLHCGSAQMEFDAFVRGLERLSAELLTLGIEPCYEEEVIESLKFISMGRSKRRRGLVSGQARWQDSASQMFDFLDTFHRTNCSDPRDRIYSLLGLLEQDVEDHFHLDIRYDGFVHETYREFAITVMEHQNHPFSVLCYAGAYHKFDSHLDRRAPSWVPDWTSQRRLRPFFTGESSFTAGGATSGCEYLVPTALGNPLMIAGFVLSEILSVSWVCPPMDYPNLYFKSIALAWWLLLASSTESSSTKAETKDFAIEFIEVVTAGRFVERDVPDEVSRSCLLNLLTRWFSEAEPMMESIAAKFQTTSAYANPYPMNEEDWIEVRKAPEILKDIFQVMTDRSVFRANDGHIGVCPGTSRSGDIIVIFLGAKTPFVLRPAGSVGFGATSKPSFEFIGTCYVERAMHGEALHSAENNHRDFALI
jgi:hypothetical protein